MANKKISDLTLISSLADTDIYEVSETATTSKKTTWSLIKSTLRTAFDLIYARIVGTPVNNQIGVWTSATQIEGDANLLWDGTSMHIAGTSGEDTLNVHGDVDIIHLAASTDDHALEIDCNAAGFGDVKAIDIDYITGNIGSTEDEGIILVNIDETLTTGGEVFGYEIITTAEGSAEIIALKTGINVAPISHDSGVFGDMDSILIKASDQLAALQNGGAGNITAFVDDSDTITIGDAANWDELEIILDTGASGGGVGPTFEYSTGVGTWSTFTPTDGTNGFKNTGAILWHAPDLSGWVVGTGSEYLIRITRNKVALTTSPILDEVQISAVTIYSWDKSGVVIVNTLKVTTGATINEFSTDGTLAGNSDVALPTEKAVKTYVDAQPEALGIAISDETTLLTTGTAKVTFRMPFAMTLTGVRANVNTAPTGSVLTVDINETASTILSTKLTIDATEFTSQTAAAAPVISDSALADDAEITIDIDGVGSTIAGKGLKVWLIGTRA